MRKYFTQIGAASLFLTILCFWNCSGENDNEPLDIITGQVSVEELYYNKKFENPTMLSGTITNNTTRQPVADATITARLDGQDIEYSALSKTDGSYSLYVEGYQDYVLSATKDGYARQLYYDYYGDTINTINGSWTMDFALSEPDLTPVFSVVYKSIRYTNENLTDLTFNGSKLVGIYLSQIYLYNLDGTLNKNSSLKSSSLDVIASQDTVFWATEDYNTRNIYKFGQKGGVKISTITCQIPYIYPIDIEVLNNSIWLMTDTDMYELTYTGSQVSHIAFNTLIADLKLVGLTKLDGYLYLLNKEIKVNNPHKGYSIFKYNPATGKIVGKGYFPDSFDNYSLKGLATDGTNFWTINNVNYTDEVIKLTLTN